VIRERLLSPYQHGASVLHRLPPGLKLGAALACILFIVLLPRSAWGLHLAIASGLAAIAIASRASLPQLLLRLLLVEPIVIGIALLALLRPDGGLLFLSMITKSTLCLACMILLTATTRFSDILGVLRRLHVPALLITSLALTHRFMFVLVEEMQRMLRARRSRTFVEDHAATWSGSSQVAGRLFVRASERAERVYLAMCARGWEQ
jgi:cobalt/nickel transport system permease protein